MDDYEYYDFFEYNTGEEALEEADEALPLAGSDHEDSDFGQGWFYVNLDKRQFHFTYNCNEALDIFWDNKRNGRPFPYTRKMAPFSIVDLMTRDYVSWPRRTAFDDAVVENLGIIRR
jgi:hypothetical protein